MGRKKLNITGKKFGELTVIKRIGYCQEKGKKRPIWLCKCKCGNFKRKEQGDLTRRRNVNLKCDKCHLEEKSNRAKSHGDSYSKLYKIWHNLRNRCDNKNDTYHYNNYGGRGIIYDFKWNKYENFKNDMWYKYTRAILCQGINIKNITIERINVNGNYNKNNCIFIPMNKQQENRRNVKIFRAISPKNKIYIEKNSAKFARNHSLTASHIRECLRGEIIHHKQWNFEYI